MNGTDGQLSNGIVEDVKRVGPGEVAGDLDDQRGRVNHTGLDDQDEDFRRTKVAGHARDHTEDIPNGKIEDVVLNPKLHEDSPNP